MRLIHDDIIAALGAGELTSFQLLTLTLDGTPYRYTDADVPIGEMVRREAITDGVEVHGLSLADGAAFCRLNGLDLSAYANSGYLLTLADASEEEASGYIDAADAAEALGSNLVTNGDMESFEGWSQTRVTLSAETGDFQEGSQSGKATRNAEVTYGYFYRTISITEGKLYKIHAWMKNVNADEITIRVGRSGEYTLIGTVTGTTWTEIVCYWTCDGSPNIVILTVYGGEGTYGLFDDIWIKEVTDVGTDGVHIVSSDGGSTRNWAAIDSSFNYNDSGYIATISGARFEPRGFRHDGAVYSAARIVDRLTLEIDNLDQTLTAAFVGGTPQGGEVTLREAVLNGSGQVIGAPVTWFGGTVDDWEADEQRVRVSAVGPNFAWSRRNAGRHPASCRWRIFKGTECAYSGAGATCSRTYARCETLGNTDNFGGFRWLPSIEDQEIWWGRKMR